ncbi:MAG: hypothetical protein K0Q73_3308 [Paenibacillus sp.]|nr:hypothetical protein [Paenibacillus sp.]
MTNNTIQQLLESITYCLRIEEDLRTAQEELRKTIREQNGLILKFKEEYGRFDSLTGLPNRQFLGVLMHQTIEMAIKEKKQAALFSINLDHFKLVNDTLGHEAGDRVLQVVARRLRMCAKGKSHVARVGGDEFVYLTMGAIDDQQLAGLSEQIQCVINQPFVVCGEEMNMTVSIGISQFPQDSQEVETLMKNADIAMNFSKDQGRNTFHFYNPRLNSLLHKRMQIEKYLRKAIERDEFIVHFQPQVDVQTLQVVGMECLIRWESPELGRVSPVDFIPIAEETGLIIRIGEWVMKKACQCNKAWQEAGLPKMIVTVNLSSRQFFDKKLEEMIQRVLNETGLSPEFLELEITESMTMAVEVALSTLNSLKKLGLKIAIDDFGTGYSSLSYLKKLPIDKLKIDQSFVKEISTNSIDAGIVSTIITMARNLNLKVIAEGVETEEALSLLKDYGCDTVQGYLFSPPIGAGQVEGMIRILEQKGRLELEKVKT